MSVTIRLGDNEATVEARRWKCASAAVERMLNADVQANPPAHYTPDVDHYLARRAVERFGGEIVRIGEPEPEAAGTV